MTDQSNGSDDNSQDGSALFRQHLSAMAQAVSKNSEDLERTKPIKRPGYAEGGDVEQAPGPGAGMDDIPGPDALSSASQPSGVPVFDPEGNPARIPQEQLQSAISQGYTEASPADVNEYHLQQRYGTPDEHLKAGIEGFGKGLLGPLSTAIERIAGVPAENIAGRQAANPGASAVGTGVGLIAPALLTAGASAAARAGVAGAGEAATALSAASKFTQAGMLERAGAAIVPEGASAIAKIGSTAAKGAIENALFQSGDEVSKYLMNDPSSASMAILDVGLSGVFGGVAGGALGTVPALWKASEGTKAGKMLHSITARLGGREGAIPDAVADALNKAGIDMTPEIRAGLLEDPAAREMFKTLEQSDTTTSGKEFQASLQNFRSQMQGRVSETLGRKLEDINPDLSHYDVGKKIGRTLASEYDKQISPLASEFDALRAKYGKTELGFALDAEAVKNAQDLGQQAVASAASGDVERASSLMEQAKDIMADAEKRKMPATAKMVDDVLGLAQSEGWASSPSSDIMREVNRITKELPLQKTIGDITNYIKEVGNSMQANPLNGAMSRAGGIIKSVLKNAEGAVIEREVGAAGGADACWRGTRPSAAPTPRRAN